MDISLLGVAGKFSVYFKLLVAAIKRMRLFEKAISQVWRATRYAVDYNTPLPTNPATSRIGIE
jgi:hypothetical protein